MLEELKQSIEKLSVIAPLYNEAENIKILNQRLINVLDQINIDYEIVYINDGSTDNSTEVIQDIKKDNSKIKSFNFDKNIGQTTALRAGFEIAEGNYCITIDADLQNPPEEIPKLLEHAPMYDLVAGYRKKRVDNINKKISSFIGNTVRNLITGDHITDTGCSLKVFKKETALKVPLYFEGMHRFLPTLIKMVGGNCLEIPVDHHARIYGKSKYNAFNRGLSGLFDCFVVKWMRSRYRKVRDQS